MNCGTCGAKIIGKDMLHEHGNCIPYLKYKLAEATKESFDDGVEVAVKALRDSSHDPTGFGEDAIMKAFEEHKKLT